MTPTDNRKPRKLGSARRGLQEARPLLQAILLGIVLATALVAAAAMAAPDGDAAARGHALPPAQEQGLRP